MRAQVAEGDAFAVASVSWAASFRQRVAAKHMRDEWRQRRRGTTAMAASIVTVIAIGLAPAIANANAVASSSSSSFSFCSRCCESGGAVEGLGDDRVRKSAKVASRASAYAPERCVGRQQRPSRRLRLRVGLGLSLSLRSARCERRGSKRARPRETEACPGPAALPFQSN